MIGRRVVAGAVAAVAVVVAGGAVLWATGGDDHHEAAPQPVRRCATLLGGECMAVFDTYLLARVRARGSGPYTAADFDAVVTAVGPEQFPELTSFRRLDATAAASPGASATATATPDAAVQYTYSVTTGKGTVSSGTRTFCPGATPRILIGAVDCS